MQEHIFWQDQYSYQLGSSMEDFLNKKIDGEEFCDRVSVLRSKLIDACNEFELELISSSEKTKAFQPDEKAKKLSDFLSVLYCECDYLMENYEND